ncbi:MAG: peptidylprolyl isomerase [Brevundimonas sp.]|uniref:peptidylprolyl isomerase n=1 Tax=Brevundimonas sp. TaxID=1871086 RepID=UPI00121C5901|nr:peptidylprolyl isomerase [Brevundimonas sp.]RZJ16354.1 MAG: peptidylprolyl isomerase [Brevundimonas sp.]
MKRFPLTLTLALALGAGAAQAQAQEAVPAAAPAPAPAPVGAVAEWRTVAAENLLVIDTTKGRILVEMAPLVAPGHVERIRLLADKGFYDGIPWHRVIDWFMSQTGDPLGNGEGQSPYPDLKGEFTFQRTPDMAFVEAATPQGLRLGWLQSLPVYSQPDALMALNGSGKVSSWATYCPGVAGMARDEGNDTANSQFFLMRHAYPSLDKRYTVWGRVVSGLDVVRGLQVGDGDNGAMAAAQPDRMIRVRVASTLPAAERPTVQIVDAGSTRFRDMIAAARTAKGADFSLCDLEFPVQVTGGA